MKSQIVIAGVGGQGILFAAGIIIEASRKAGETVFASETHGMSQRGGSVTSHLKIGRFTSPLISEGDADVLLGLEATETLRTLPFLRASDGKSGSTCFVSVPGPGVFPDRRVEALLRDMGVNIHTCAADAEALRLGNIKAANLVLLGFASRFPEFPFTKDEMKAALEAASPPGQRKFNLEAFENGSNLPDLSDAKAAANF